MQFDRPHVLVAVACPTDAECLYARLDALGCRPVMAADAGELSAMAQRAMDEGDPFQLALVDIELMRSEPGVLRNMSVEHREQGAMALVVIADANEPTAEDEGQMTILSRPVTEASVRECLAFHLQGQQNTREPTPEQPRKSRVDGSADDQIRILLVEDNLPNQQVACATLEQAGLAYELVADGRAAIEALESRPFDLVLMDCFLPVLDGFAATRAIRASDSKVLDRNVPIIAVTALASQGDRQKCLQAGMDDYLSKPFNPQELVEIIRRHLGKDSQRDPARASDGFREDARPVSGGLDPELLEPMLDMLVEEIPRQIDRIQAALAARDAQKLGTICHELRGYAGILGTTSISNMAFAIEAASQHGDTDRVVTLTSKLLAEIQKLSTELHLPGTQKDE